MRKGICVAGTMVVDILYPIDGWPQQGGLAKILEEGISRSTGGAACNVAIDLARLDPTLPVRVLGLAGRDAEGDLILERLGACPNIDTRGILRQGMTGRTLVMDDAKGGQRTFFVCMGANTRFDEDCIDWDSIEADILHIGYILLMDALDRPDDEYGTKTARLLCHARQRGMKTSVDLVSEAGDRYPQVVPPALKYANYCVINEFEAQQLTGVALRGADGALIEANMPGALEIMRAMGVSDWAVIHCPEGGYGMDAAGRCVIRPSLELPAGYIQGTVGAGDAFCAGVLLGAEQGMALADAIDLGNAVAAAALGSADATGGVGTREEVMKRFGRFPLRRR